MDLEALALDKLSGEECGKWRADLWMTRELTKRFVSNECPGSGTNVLQDQAVITCVNALTV